MSFMRTGTRLTILSALLLGLLSGCQGMGRRGRMAAAEPPLDLGPSAGPTLVQAEPPPRSVTWVDRHPMFAAPRDLYNNTNGSKAVKVASATVVGVPVGVFGEIKQIVTGTPPELRNGY